MAGRLRTTLKHLDHQIRTLAEVSAAIQQKMPGPYVCRDVDSLGETGAAWRRAFDAVQESWIAIDQLAGLIAKQNDIPRGVDPHATPIETNAAFVATVEWWCRIRGLPVAAAMHRIECGMSPESALQLRMKEAEYSQLVRLLGEEAMRLPGHTDADSDGDRPDDAAIEDGSDLDSDMLLES